MTIDLTLYAQVRKMRKHVEAVQFLFLVNWFGSGDLLDPRTSFLPALVNSATLTPPSTTSVAPLLAHTHTRWSDDGEVLASDPPPMGRGVVAHFLCE